MSIDLDWDTLDALLAQELAALLNRQIAATNRPSFIGPIEILSIDFGTSAPDIELVDVRDIYRDFVECDDEDQNNADEKQHPTSVSQSEDVDGFEWVSRRAVLKGMAVEAPTYHHLPPHLRYGHGPSADLFNGMSNIARTHVWASAGMASMPNLRDSMGTGASSIFPPTPLSASFAGYMNRTSLTSEQANIPLSTILRDSFPGVNTPEVTVPPSREDTLPTPPELEVTEDIKPDLQLHLHVAWTSNLRLTLTTSMLINYPSPSFMSLPIKLSVTGLVFNGEVVLAYEGSKKRIHLCILDDMDPYGPRTPRTPLHDSDHTPPDIDGPLPYRIPPTKPRPAGNRLLPSIFIESEIGQEDKHVLKNVTRVERFIQDLIRRSVEDELVFPNFHTMLLP